MNENVKKVKGHLSFSDVFEDATKHCRKIPASNYLESGIYQIIDQGQNNIAGYTNDSIDLYTDTPVIIFGDHTRVVKYIDKPFFIGADGVKVLKPKTNELNTKYLYYVLSNAKIPNTGYNRHFKWLKEIKIPVFSFSMQEEIVSLLNKIETIIDKRKQQLENLDKLIKSQFIEMFGDPASNPYGWEIVTIGDVVTEVRYGTSNPAVEGGQYPYLRMNNITCDGHLDLSNMKYIDISDDEIEKYIVRKGDILFNRTNSIELVGKTCLFDLDDPMVIAGYIIRIRLNNSLLPVVLSNYLNSNRIKDQLRSMAKGAVNQANINAKELQSIKVYLPPIDRQNKFSHFVEQTDKSKFTIKQSLEQLEILKKSLMQKYFG